MPFGEGVVQFESPVRRSLRLRHDHTWIPAVAEAEHGIGVFEVRPGIIQTDMTGPVQEKYDKLIGDGLTPIRRWGQPADIGKAVVAIAKNLLPFSTGEVINVDGGFHLRSL